MNDRELILMREAIDGLRKILKESLPHCDDGNPLESKFVSINKTAYDSLQKFEKSEKLIIQKLE
jgi:hypothetical protein